MKEVRETPLKQNQRFIEFYDTRDAAKACVGMNGKEINGRHLIIEFSRPGGHNRRFPKSTHNKLNCIPNHPPRSPRLVPPHQASSEEPYCSRLQPQLPSRNTKNPNGSRKTSTGQGAPVGSLCLSGAEGVEISNKISKKSGAACSGNGSSSGTNNLKQVNDKKAGGGNNKGWKGIGTLKNGKEYDPRFLINEDSILLSNCSDPRTTVMIKNIPNKYRYFLICLMFLVIC